MQHRQNLDVLSFQAIGHQEGSAGYHELAGILHSARTAHVGELLNSFYCRKDPLDRFRRGPGIFSIQVLKCGLQMPHGTLRPQHFHRRCHLAVIFLTLP